MNKQQLASKIWESANKLRSKIEANEYKDYILGFIFYKFLSTKEELFLRREGWEDEDFSESLTEEDEVTREHIRANLGYFISYNDLYSTWLSKGVAFNVSDVTDALGNFTRLVTPKHKPLFSKIFATLETGLTKLGDNAGSRTKAISGLLQLIKDIPMDGSEDYDVLGFIYEYLISNFAANAGKKAGEFYTPHEVSLLMSEIVAWHLRDRERIEIYDPTSGSGSLLINIGRVVARHMGDPNNIKYYAQELKENTYNLTRMNLVMRGILPDNIVVRNGDTLEEDWPYFDDQTPYSPLFVDAVVSNPPYSQHWDPTDKKSNPRFADYGLAPKSKADYAFLLHDLYHLKSNGIMTIVLPHGVLFRGGEEGIIRKNLVEKNNIDAIIGLPANIFFGTAIPTIIMVLRKSRPNTDVLIIDTSKYYEKVGKNNRLRTSDIQRIVDVLKERRSVPKFSRVVSRNEIRDNDYNLNIPRYVDTSEAPESWDILATMQGGIPNSEIDALTPYWNAFPGLRDELFYNDGSPYSTLRSDNFALIIATNPTVMTWQTAYDDAFSTFPAFLRMQLLAGIGDGEKKADEDVIRLDVFDRLASVPLVDRYAAYQLLDDEWPVIDGDLETIRRDGFDAVRAVDPHMVLKKKDGVEGEVQDGFEGRIIPFELAQIHLPLLAEEVASLKKQEDRLSEINGEYEEIIDSLSEEEKDGDFLNEDNTAFVAAELKKKVKEIYDDVDSAELRALRGYVSLLDLKASKALKLNYIKEHMEADWSAIQGTGVYAKGKVIERIKELQEDFIFDPDSCEHKLIRALTLVDEEKEVKKAIKELSTSLHIHTKEAIECLSDTDALMLLEQKWIEPLQRALMGLPSNVLSDLTSAVHKLATKYNVTFKALDADIREVEQSLSTMLGDLTGEECDMLGICELQKLLGGK